MAQSDDHHDPKTGKDNNIGKNWRPISLLCPAAKTLEKLLLPKISTHIPFHLAQHGFRPKHPSCTALSTITADITIGISRKKPAHRTVLASLDLTADCIRQCGPSTITRLCLQRRLTGNNPSLALQLYAEQTSQS